MQVVEAMSLCLLQGKDSPKAIQSESISSAEFFTATIAKLRSFSDSNRQDLLSRDDILENDGEKVEIMQMTYDFIKLWEPSILTILPSVSNAGCISMTS
jgi:hypothetical protein